MTEPAPLYRQELIDLYVDRYTRAHQTAFVRLYRGVLGDGEQVLYEGRARVHRLSGAVQMGFGDEPQYMVSGTVSLPRTDADGNEVMPQVDDTLVVLTHRDDKTVGRSFRVMHVDAGGQFKEMVQLSVIGSEESPTAPSLPRPPAGWPS